VIIKKTPTQIEKMERAGRVLAEVISELGQAVVPGVTLRELDEMADRSIRLRGAIPSFLGYRGFPASICASPNDVVVHGIPDDRELKEGDIFSADFGLILDGWHADSAYTFAVGEVPGEASRLLEVTVESLHAGIALCRPGQRLGDVGHAIEAVVHGAGFSVVREFVGHGIGRSLHEDPQVPNFGPAGRGPVLEEGWVLAIEPMVNMGGWRTRVLDDGWTVVTADHSLSAHFEHTVAVTADGPKVLTAPAA
jgi:methionyl aminopeptidase